MTTSQSETIDWSNALARRTNRMRASEIRELLKLLDQPDIISFAGGIPNPDLFPAKAVSEAYANILGGRESGKALQYSISEGYPPLRRWIAQQMERMGVACGIENIVITCGSQQGLDFLGKLLLTEGDTALVAAPTYLGALQAFNAYEPRYDILPGEESNLTPAHYRAAARAANSRLALAYAVTDFANPTGITMSEAGRNKLIDLVTELGIPLIEDAAYSALRFEGDPVRSCLALDVARKGAIDLSSVVYCGTFSKTIAPGLRVGWVCAARDLIQKIVLAKQAGDLHSPTINQMVMHEVVEAVYEGQIRKIRADYVKRRDAMLAALEKSMPKGVTWTKPQGGMFVWLTVPERMDSTVLLERAIKEERVAFVPGAAFFVDGTGHNTMRLSYSLPSPEIIEQGIERLAQLIIKAS